MLRKFAHLFALTLIVTCAIGSSEAQQWSGILDPTRAIDWASNSGIPGGIPNRTTVCATINASTYGNGSSDATSGIQTALNNCAANQVVSLSAGTFRISSLRIPSNVTLRGAGADSTKLDLRGSAAAGIVFGSGSDPSTSNSTSITGGATQGSTSITVSSASGITVGSYLMITELNDSSYVTINVPNGSCTWCDGGIGWNGTRVRGQVVEVTSVSGTTIGITPLYSKYSLTPLATRITAGAKYAGVENLKVSANNTGYTSNFLMRSAAYCWIKGVESDFADADHVEAYWSYRGEIRDSYFHDGFVHSAGSSDNDLFIANKTSGFLIENNITTRMHVSIMLNWGAAGNVIAYNYSDGDYDDSATNAILGDMSVHGAHPAYNLWEGNSFISLYPDSVWGTSSHNTAYRNWWRGTTQICLPYSSRGAMGACHWAVQAIRAVQIAFTNSSFNSVGNVVGSAEMAALKVYNGSTAMGQVASIVNPTSRSYDQTAYGYTWGYDNLSDGGGGSPGQSYSTRFLHGDFNNVDKSTTWVSGKTQTLPASFYKSGKPSWWGTMPWPAIGPDVTGGTGPSGHTYSIPAQACYQKAARDANGYPIFNAAACYGSGTSTTLNPPTGVVAVPK